MIHEDIAFFFVEKKSGRALGRTFDQSVVTEKNKGDLRIRGAEVNNSMAVMSFRRLVHLVVDDVGLRRTYSLRSIDMSRLFRRPPRESTGGCGRPDQPPPTEEDHEMKPCPLPAPTMTFYPPRRWDFDGEMAFMLLGGRHNNVVAADQTGRARRPLRSRPARRPHLARLRCVVQVRAGLPHR